MKKKWYLRNKTRNNDINGLTPILSQILNNRGLTEKKAVETFLYGSIGDLYDPFLLEDMDKAVRRINKAINNHEKILVFGDYDVDGITSTTLIYRYFKETFNYQVDFYLPDRQKEGYGLNIEAIKGFCQKKYDLLLTVDCGITAIEEVAYAITNGLDVIVTDHHQPGDIIPEALAIINPHRKNDKYPYKYLAGVGVAFKLCQALEYSISGKYISEHLLNLIDIVTLGTVADIVALTGENRFIVKKGLELINNTHNLGLRKLIDKVGLANKDISTGHISYIIAPHLNAAGRVSDPEVCVELLITDDPDKAEHIAAELNMTNKERQELEQRILDEAKEMVENQINLEEEKAIILASKNWNYGVIGIVASRLVELYYRPTILIAIDQEGEGKGSCRSINGLNIYQALNECSHYLKGFGGHKMAAGLTIAPGALSDFKNSFNKVVNDYLDDGDFIPELGLDALLQQEDINIKLYKDLYLLEPYGMGNPRPKFMLNNVRINKAYVVGKNKNHLSFSLDSGIRGIGFGYGDKLSEFYNQKLDLAFHLDLNEWNGKTEVQLCLEDFSIRSQLKYFPIEYRGDGYILADKRGCHDTGGYLKELINLNHKIAVYINNLKLYHRIKMELGEEFVFLAKKPSEVKEFRKINKGILFFTTNMINDISLSDKQGAYIKDLVFLSLPFSLKEMKKVIDVLSFEDIRVHLLYSEKDVVINKGILQKKIPNARYLRQLYLYLKACSKESIIFDELKELIIRDKKIYSNKDIIKKGIEIFEELGLVENHGTTVLLLPEPGKKLDLSNSISYNNNVNVVEKYNCFVDLALARDLFLLIDKINIYEEDKKWI